MYTAERHHGLIHNLHQRGFNALYNRSLLYNACWEDPALDRVALDLTSDSEVLVITSAGCNALDYALDAPKRIYAVDANPRQTALLELKIAGIRRLDYRDFWKIFGEGVHGDMPRLYRRYLRQDLSPAAREFWDARQSWWSGRGWRNTFYYYGLSGLFAKLVGMFIRARPRLHKALYKLFRCETIAEQQEIYATDIAESLFPASLRWVLNRQTTLYLLGVPYEQGRVVTGEENEGVAAFIQECIAAICQTLPMKDNYFWRVYAEGSYAPDCCPEYLRRSQFHQLKAGAVDCIVPVTDTITEFLKTDVANPSHFILLDHMDWMGEAYPMHLVEEWQWILRTARANGRVLFRSGAKLPGFLDLSVEHAGNARPMREWMAFNEPLAGDLHKRDRVHTYASFFIGDLVPRVA